MTVPSPPPDPAVTPISAERHIAQSTLAQQGAQIVGVASMLVVITILGRTLTLSEFGVYGLLLSIVAYVLIIQLSVEGATVRALAAHTTTADRSRIFSTAIALYAVFGALSGLAIVGGGLGAVALLNVPATLYEEAQRAILALALVTALGWPFKAFQDALRGTQRFFSASAAEIAAHISYVAVTAALVIADAPLWALITIGGSLPVLIGLGSAMVIAVQRLPFRFRRRDADRAIARDLLGFSAYLFATALADLVLYSLDRVILAAFRPATTVGLFEGAVRPHNLVRQLHGTLVLTVMPVASGYIGEDDQSRLRELLLRGTRYVLAAVVPVVVTLMVLSGPVLEVWLGSDFRPAGLAMAILLSYWLVGANTGVGGAMLVAAGRVRQLTIYAWAMAGLNLAISLALTPWLGLEGVALGTAIPYLVLLPVFLRLVVRTFPVSVAEMAREAWLPAYSLGILLAAGLVAVRLVTPLDSLGPLVLVAVGGLASYFAAYYAVWLRSPERALVRSLVRSLVRV